LDASQQNRFQRRKEQTRKKLIDAAISLILEHGYDAVTIDEIVARADVGKGTFYLHFKDKESLVWEVIRKEVEAIQRESDERYRAVPLEHIPYPGFVVFFEYAARNQDLFRIMLGSQGHSIFTQHIKQFLIEETMREIQANFAFTDIGLPAEFVAHYVVGALIELQIWWLETPNSYSPIQMAQMFYQMIFRKPPPSGLISPAVGGK